MKFVKTRLDGAFIVEPEAEADGSGFLAGSWCQHEFEMLGIHKKPVQSNVSFNKKRGTLRGLHYQAAPYSEAKLVRCTLGAVYDVIADLRPDSPTYQQWMSVELTQKNRRLLYVPEGFAHGFMTLRDNTEVFYQMTRFYMPEYSRGIRWNDPLFEIKWPLKVSEISDKDRQYPDFVPSAVSLSKTGF
ncbi:MAG: dTDP-4-dehydrorhamnose 3,5-epimerase [Nitrospiraceae bacterium]|nr:dTDP-4-dehydrorhamnose 3,5-epimerase [Nitrospiraceae bacterium]